LCFVVVFVVVFKKTGHVRLQMEDVPVLLASSTGLPRKRAHWPTESLASSSQSAGLGP